MLRNPVTSILQISLLPQSFTIVLVLLCIGHRQGIPQVANFSNVGPSPQCDGRWIDVVTQHQEICDAPPPALAPFPARNRTALYGSGHCERAPHHESDTTAFLVSQTRLLADGCALQLSASSCALFFLCVLCVL